MTNFSSKEKVLVLEVYSIQSGLKTRYSMRARQQACQNMMFAVPSSSLILLMVPLTIFAKPLLG